MSIAFESNVKVSISETDERYWAKAVENELRSIAENITVGDRNSGFFRSACSVFSIVKAGIGTKAEAENLLIQAAKESGYAEDEPQQTLTTMASAWRTATPRDLTRKGQEKETASSSRGTITIQDLGQPRAKIPPITLTTGAAPVAAQADQILEAFVVRNGDEPRLFKANTLLTRLRFDEVGGTRLEPLTNNALKHEIDRAANFVTKQNSYTAAPASVVSHIAGAPDYNLPPIRGIRYAPYFAADGRLVDKPGYDRGTEYYFELPQGLNIPAVPKSPSPSEIQWALRSLLDVIVDFPFRDRASKRVYLSLLLLPFCRDLIDGPTPIHIIGKPAPGTGAGLAVDVFAMISTGRTAVAQAEAESNAEFRKNLTAFLLQGSPYYFLDNLHQCLNDPAFAAALTTGYWQDRVLGRSELVNLLIRNTWIVAGNNPEFSEEIARRSVLIWLDARMADPCTRTKFRHPALVEYVRARRGALISACLTLVQAWVRERHLVKIGTTIGTLDPDRLEEALARAKEQNHRVTIERKVPGSARLATFDNWAWTMSGILEGAGVRGLLDDRSKLKDHTTDAASGLRQFMCLWYSMHRDTDVRIGSFEKGGQTENYALVPTKGTLVELLHGHKGEIDLGFNGRPEAAWQTKMGAVLSNAVDRVFEVGDSAAGTVQAKIVKTRGSGGISYRLELVS